MTDRAYPRDLAPACVAVIEAATDEKALCQQAMTATGSWPPSILAMVHARGGAGSVMAILVRGEERLVAAAAPEAAWENVEAVVDEMVRRIHQSGRRPLSIEGTIEMLEHLAERLARVGLLDPPSDPAVSQTLMALRGASIEPAPAPGSWRLAEDADLPAVRALLLHGLGAHPNLDVIALVSILYRRAILWVVDQPVALLCSNYPVPFAQSITNVVTLPEHRGRGYGANLLHQVARRWLASVRGGLSMLFVLQDSPARRLYERMGYRADVEWRIVKFRPNEAAKPQGPESGA